MKNGEEKDITIEINAIYEYEAPIEKGTKIGNLIVKNKSEIIETIDIISSKEVERKNTITYLKYLIKFIRNPIVF